MMRTPLEIKDIRWHPYRVPLAGRFTSAHEVLATREGIIIEIETLSGIIGIGECAPLPAFSGGTLADALMALPLAVGLMRGATLLTALALLEEPAKNVPAVIVCGLETALLDALSQSTACSVAKLLATESSLRVAVTVNAVVGAQSLSQAVLQAKDAVEAGFSCVKLKLTDNIATSLELVEAVRATFGPETHLRLDANESWDFASARSILSECERFDIQYVEQPLSRHDLYGMAELRRLTSIPLAADEMISDLTSARLALDAQVADILIIKPQLAGGLRQGRQIIREANARGMRCVVTSTIETGVGVCAALQLAAACPEIELECGLATLTTLVDDLIEDNLPVLHGRMAVPTGNGLGVRLDRVALLAYEQPL